MAEPLPAALKIPEVSRFINRANQLRTFKPAIAYWCEYHAVNQIVSKGLHNTDDDSFNFTRTLLERLETTKTERADDDAIMDNTAGQAYVEQFAQETFSRAERTMRANKVTRQTADTFDAAATFFDVTHEWGTPEAEVLQKMKFAKWNAARILKAIREGRDPNESNPQMQEEPDEAAPLDPNDPDVQELSTPSAPRPVAVEDAPDAGELPQQPLESPGPVEEGYFPPPPPPPPVPEQFVPSPLSHESAPSPWGIPPPQPPPESHTQIPPQPSPQIPTKVPSEYTPGYEAPPAASPPTWTASPAGAHPPASAPQAWAAPSPVSAGPPPVVPSQPVAQPYVPPAPAPTAHAVGSIAHIKDINQAQKHAKWAISALNFEDVPTAIKELQNALAMLGAR